MLNIQIQALGETQTHTPASMKGVQLGKHNRWIPKPSVAPACSKKLKCGCRLNKCGLRFYFLIDSADSEKRMSLCRGCSLTRVNQEKAGEVTRTKTGKNCLKQTPNNKILLDARLSQEPAQCTLTSEGLPCVLLRDIIRRAMTLVFAQRQKTIHLVPSHNHARIVKAVVFWRISLMSPS